MSKATIQTVALRLGELSRKIDAWLAEHNLVTYDWNPTLAALLRA